MKTFTAITPIGPLTIVVEAQQIMRVEFGGKLKAYAPDVFTKKIVRQFEEYFLKKRKAFDLPFVLKGTPFQQKVWRALAEIPYGETRTYQELANQLKTGARAIGNACRANPVVVVIPCHRIVAKSGLGGFAGKTKGKMMHVKEDLLALEK